MNTGDKVKDTRSKSRLGTVHKDLQRLFRHMAAGPTTFVITEGLRTPERQLQLFNAGASRTLNSKHLTGRAVDVAITVGREVRWDWPLYEAFAEKVKAAALILNLSITWGGDWISFRDGPHYELQDGA